MKARYTSTKVAYSSEEVRRNFVKPTFVCDTELLTESNQLAGIEVKMNKTSVCDDVPVHFSVAILQWSKVLFHR